MVLHSKLLNYVFQLSMKWHFYVILSIFSWKFHRRWGIFVIISTIYYCLYVQWSSLTKLLTPVCSSTWWKGPTQCWYNGQVNPLQTAHDTEKCPLDVKNGEHTVTVRTEALRTSKRAAIYVNGHVEDVSKLISLMQHIINLLH
jgi:hypothetical protein